MKIYVFGNLLVKEDNLPIKILPKLKKLFPEIQFEIADPNENFPPEEEKDLVILDTVKGLKEPKILKFEELQSMERTPNSPHDYDLMLHLQLLKKLKKINSVRIFGIPLSLDIGMTINWLKRVIPDLPRPSKPIGEVGIRNPELNRSR
ncbi:hypothetical protein A3A46_02545 [Candidatus Roizmanbacteria bacterium RIFCSPLOWO2_01_FULL_37_13]|uniref:Uncharacterized protein n=1 Tax=Candidatus Roizmanbacteria bacterium RIFCSPHIGHO2_02_FULL_38_11 TaxID=1802039 RepID=A0A1F7H3R1_9BACT|nr:MAG: hypothetical protein A3C25_04110 [Candidatus Roizmanbacteria bacterium RIFCSPHIGHO2_02_FULL_38_11]OGK33436.1 MAG: hypothetical protein A3F58_02085 [Candidatus Roizmanbacteria bacterium RIFCSPHIGHO2_12_FULL_37_9b]OGK41452.1 MAG: hypothetical protein A3A46_02545 [Candidatus Roizmanbacteria bacterium RIFCSPLOWO2_01_FULL_37_13]